MWGGVSDGLEVDRLSPISANDICDGESIGEVGKGDTLPEEETI